MHNDVNTGLVNIKLIPKWWKTFIHIHHMCQMTYRTVSHVRHRVNTQKPKSIRSIQSLDTFHRQ